MRRPRGLTPIWALLALATLAAPAAAQPGPGARAEPAPGARGMVVASQADAARAGRLQLERGGNAVDAAVATAFALAVTQPFSAGLGGGAFVLIREPGGRVVAIDARETAPARADRDLYVRPGVAPDASLQGPLAVATPGFVRGMAEALEGWGTQPWAEVLAPAIRLAEEGFAIGPYHARMLERLRQAGFAKRFPETARIQFPGAGAAGAEPGWILRQPELAASLRELAARGPDAFYTGAIARRIAAEMSARGGLVSAEDLAGYRAVRREAVAGTYRGIEVVSFPPPSSGGAVLIEALNILEGFDLAELGPDDPTAAHRVVEASKLAFADRAVWMGDPDFVDVPVARLTSKAYASELRARIVPPLWKRWLLGADERAVPVEAPGLAADDAGTTHLSATDASGRAVALTMTINTPFGSGLTVPGTGILLNNEMDDFAVAPDRPNAYGLVDTRGANAIAPGKRPLSSMTPTILVKDGRAVFVTGSPGGPRIITTVLLTIVNTVDFGMDVPQAVAAPRYHHQWMPDRVAAEPLLPAEVVEGLRARGHEVVVEPYPWSSAQAIAIDPSTGLHQGGSDPRSDGAALGW
jgi:gamma-glutamyltranspeptidase/glutathione hydrolase